MGAKILVLSPIDSEAVERLSAVHQVTCPAQTTEEALKGLAGDCDIVVFRSGVNITRELLTAAPRLRLIIRAGSGFDNIDLEAMREFGIEFVRIPEPGAQSVAEMSFALMLAMSRRLFEADRSMRQARWAKFELGGYLLKNKVLGIVGLGNIGTRVAELGLAWGMRLVGCVEHFSDSRRAEFEKKGITLETLEDVLAQSDYVSLHVPLKETTRGLIGAKELARIKPGSYLVNLARGGVVDEAALGEALANGGRLRAAALDVHQREGEGKLSPLAALPNVILTPHIGAMAVDAQREIGRRVVEIADSWARAHESTDRVERSKTS